MFLLYLVVFLRDDGKRLQACLKRLELLDRAKPKIGGVWGGGTGKAGRSPGFLARGLLFWFFFRSKIVLKINMFFDRFWLRFGTHFGVIWEAKIDPNRAKLGPRRLSKRYFFKNADFHADLRFPMFFHQNRPQDEAKIDLRSPQDIPKAVLVRCFFCFFDPRMGPKIASRPVQDGSKSDKNVMHFSS